MGINTLLQYLTGRRHAIITMAQDRRTLWLGALFVLAAAFARTYDSHDLLHQSWRLAVPFIASFVMALLLFILLRLGMPAGGLYPGFAAAFRSFLGLLWMTAPLALLYAIPYDRFLPPGAAMQAHLATLGLVAVWRVLLFTRVISVVFGVGYLSAFFVVMLVADAAVLTALETAKLPTLIQIMGGVRLTQREDAIATVAFLAGIATFFSGLLWLFGAFIVLSQRRMKWQIEPPAAAQPVSPMLLVAAGCALLVWAPILPFTQPPQQLRTLTENQMRAGHIVEGLALMSAHTPRDYPPYWDPPPRPAYDESDPPLLDVLDVIIDRGCADWVRRIYLRKLEDGCLENARFFNDADVHRILGIVDRLPEGPAMRARHPYTVQLLNQFPPSTAPATSP